MASGCSESCAFILWVKRCGDIGESMNLQKFRSTIIGKLQSYQSSSHHTTYFSYRPYGPQPQDEKLQECFDVDHYGPPICG